MAYKRTSWSTGKGSKTTRTVNTKTGKSTTSFTTKMGSTTRTTSQQSGGKSGKPKIVFYTTNNSGGWITRTQKTSGDASTSANARRSGRGRKSNSQSSAGSSTLTLGGIVAIVVFLLIGGVVKAFSPPSPVTEAASTPPAPPAVNRAAVEMAPNNTAAQLETEPETANDFVADVMPSELADGSPSIGVPDTAEAALAAVPGSESATEVAPSLITLRTKPKIGRQFKMPEYPAASQRAGEAGDVTVSTCVDAEGRMSSVQLVKSSGYPRLDDATITNLPKSRLEPAIGSDGKPMAMCDPPYVMTIAWTLAK